MIFLNALLVLFSLGTLSGYAKNCTAILDEKERLGIIEAADQSGYDFKVLIKPEIMVEGLKTLLFDLAPESSVGEKEFERVAREYASDPSRKNFLLKTMDGKTIRVEKSLEDLIKEIDFFGPASVYPKDDFIPVVLGPGNSLLKLLKLSGSNSHTVEKQDGYFGNIGVTRTLEKAIISNLRMWQAGNVYVDVEYHWKEGLWNGGPYTNSSRGIEDYKSGPSVTSEVKEIIDLRTGKGVAIFRKLPQKIQEAILAVTKGAKPVFGINVFDR